MSIIKSIFTDVKPKDILNPISQLEGDCLLMNTKKDKYYTHIYDARPILSKLRDELKVSEEVISKFDLPLEPRPNCCNVVSIMLYFKKTPELTPHGYMCDTYDMIKYLNSINRSVKNVHKKLPDWLVRIYFDKSVYECMETLQKLKTDEKNEQQTQYETILTKFDEIITSPNVEIYTYDCKSFYVDGKITENIRSLRFLVLIDPTVNICAIREADGYITNLECHNLKIFSSQKHNRLFYLPVLTHLSQFELINDSGFYQSLISYSKWLKIYKSTFGFNYFRTHQNIYELLAGMFTTKLKINPEFYFRQSREVSKEIENIAKSTFEEFNEKYPENKYVSNISNMQEIIKQLYIGFDEILLLDIYKEIISVPVNFSHYMIGDNTDPKIVKQLKDSLFFAKNILTLSYDERTNQTSIIKDLKDKQIIPQSFDETKLNPKLSYKEYDPYVLKEIIYPDIFNITFGEYGEGISNELNNQYRITKDSPYDFEMKYLKYKQKYLMLKNKLHQ
jgi:hypothetical protein